MPPQRHCGDVVDDVWPRRRVRTRRLGCRSSRTPRSTPRCRAFWEARPRGFQPL